MSKEADKSVPSNTKKGNATVLASGVILLSDEELDTEETLASEFRGLYKSRLKEMQSAEEEREAAHRVGCFIQYFYLQLPRFQINANERAIILLTFR